MKDSFVILYDTREQTGFEFSGDIAVENATVPLGDYTIKGLEYDVTVERKSLSDLVGSITVGRDRFVRELKGMRRYHFAAIVVEATWEDIEEHRYRSATNPGSVLETLMSFEAKYGVRIHMAGNHKRAGQHCESLLKHYARIVDRRYKAMHAHEVKAAREETKRKNELKKEAAAEKKKLASAKKKARAAKKDKPNEGMES